jgi:hypothetical protein
MTSVISDTSTVSLTKQSAEAAKNAADIAAGAVKSSSEKLSRRGKPGLLRGKKRHGI